MPSRARSHWGWGYADEALPHEQVRAAAGGLAQHLGFGDPEPERPVPLEAIEMPAPRLAQPPGALGEICTSDRDERVRHAYGRAYRDVVRAFRGRIDHAPDVVARPRTEEEVERVLAWAADAGAAVIPFGGGTSVVGGVEARVPDRFAGVVTLSLARLDRVLEVDAVSQAARIQAGALGPHLEEQLAAHGLTLRHFPQSFQLSTLGGWIATRAGGHFATGETHVDDLVESVRAITPAGVWASRRLPGSGAGPSPDRLLLGNEGTLGAITEAWVRVRPKPTERAGRAVRFARVRRRRGRRARDRASGAGAVQLPSRRRARGGADVRGRRLGGAAGARLRVVGRAGAGAHASGAGDLPRARRRVGRGRRPARERRFGLRSSRATTSGRRHRVARGVPARALRARCLRRDGRPERDVRDGDHVGALRPLRGGREGCGERRGARGLRRPRASSPAASRTPTPTAPRPTSPSLAPARRGEEVEQWGAIKRAASEAILAGGGTITHHHAVGRDHRPWYDAQRPEPFAAALRGAKAAVDPAGLLNPGVLIDPIAG